MDVDFLRYKFEDGYDGVITKNKFKLGVRHIQLAYMVVASVAMGSLRGTVSVAVLAMTDLDRRNQTYVQIHDWDRRIQGTILSAFFFGYAVMFVPAALYMHKFSSKLVMTAALLVNGALCVAMPTIANKGGWIPVCNAHMIMGMTQGCVCPAQRALVQRWFPPSERRTVNALVYGGLLLGIICALPIAQTISEFRLSWELVFYSQAMLTLALGTIWLLLTSDTPEEHQAIGDKEKEFLEQALSNYTKVHNKVPWRSILSSKQFWCIVCAHASSNAIFVFYLADVPSLMKHVTGYLKEASFIPFMAFWFMYLMTAPTIKLLYRIGFITYLLSLTHYRKIVNGIGACGVVIGLTVLPHALHSSHLAIVVLVVTLALAGFQYSGFLENLKDMSEHQRRWLLAASSAAAAAVGAVVPMLTGLLLADDMSNPRRWRSVLAALASLHALANIVYTGFSSSERQHWDMNTEKFGYHNGFMRDAELELEELKQTKLPEHDTAL